MTNSSIASSKPVTSQATSETAEEGEPATGEPPESPLGQVTFAGESAPAHFCSTLRIELNCLVDDTDPPLGGWLEGRLFQVATLAGLRDGVLSLAVVDQETMTELNQRYRGECHATDVLAFDLRRSPDDPLDGEVVLCLETAAREARARGHHVQLEVLLYAVHGLLHLLGHEDGLPQQARAMHHLEDDLLRKAGLEPVYGSPEGGLIDGAAAPDAAPASACEDLTKRGRWNSKRG